MSADRTHFLCLYIKGSDQKKLSTLIITKIK